MQPARDTGFRDLTLAEFVGRLASSDPVPGGGSAAAVAASFGAGLVTMVATLSIGRERYARHAAMLKVAAAAGVDLADRLLELADRDAAAYAAFAAALKLPRDTDADQSARAAAIAAAARVASEVPLETLRACVELTAVAERLAGRSNVNASSDLTVAALLAEACANAAGANVIVNLPSVTDGAWAESAAATVVELKSTVEDLAQMTRELVGSRESREPIDMADGN